MSETETAEHAGRKPRRRRTGGGPRRGWRLPLVGLVLAAAAAGAYALASGSDDAGPGYRLATVERGPIDSTVSASGTVKALTTVEVGSQVSGQISEILADFNAAVRKDDVIARIDPVAFQARLVEAESNLRVAEATVTVEKARLKGLEADTEAARAALRAAEQDLVRQRRLHGTRNVAEAVYERAVATHDQARSRLVAAEAKEAEQAAAILIAEARVAQNRAILDQRQIDLDRTVIRSPVDGIVIARAVDVGQTVAASLQSPVLFKIAEDLRKMQVEVSVDEADIGRIADGQKAEFTVDAFGGRVFEGVVRQVRKEPVDVQNVVTYTVIVATDNDDLRLLPGMTANVTFFISRRSGVLKLANAALRFRPPGAERAVVDRGAAMAERREAARAEQRRLAKKLDLTEAQTASYEEIQRDMAERFRAMRGSGGGRGAGGGRGGGGDGAVAAGGTERGAGNRERGKMREALALELQRRLMAILTDDQQAAYRAYLAERQALQTRPAVVYVLEDGQPRPVTVMLGISDGTHTEILSGLTDGQQVIGGLRTAGDAAGGRSGGSGRGRRLAF